MILNKTFKIHTGAHLLMMRDTLQSGEVKSSHLDAELVSCYCAFHQSTLYMVHSTSQRCTWCIPPVNTVHGGQLEGLTVRKEVGLRGQREALYCFGLDHLSR